MILSIDTETNGIDFNHGTKPFAVTTCDEKGNLNWWEWDVNPMTRNPRVDRKELAEVYDLVMSADELVLQNAKFDVKALGSLDRRFLDNWPWHKTHDVPVYAHLLHSKGKGQRNLTALSIKYARTDISRFEEVLHAAVQTARRLAKKHRPKWLVARKDWPQVMPSAKGKGYWKADYWLPAALIKSVERWGKKHEQYILEKHSEFRTVLIDYARKDPEVTLAVFLRMRELVRERGLERWAEHRRKQVPVFARMEYKGVTLNGKNLKDLTLEYRVESERCRRVCTNIAKGLGYDLNLPANGVNESLRRFVFDVLKMPGVPNPKGKTDAPCLNKEVIGLYLKEHLPKTSKPAAFFRALQAARQRDTAVSYMAGYKRFRLPHINPDTGEQDKDWWVLYPSVNMTGTDTLRGSSRDPNEQNISKKEGFNLRHCFGPAPGREWWSMDAKNLELRLPAYECREQALIDLFEKPNEAPYFGSNHMVNFAAVYPEIWEPALKKYGPKEVAGVIKKVTEYGWCKNGWFAIQYGAVMQAMGWGTADRAFHKQGAHSLLFSRLNRLGGLSKHWIEFANKYGYVETIPDKTVDPERGYPLVVTRNQWGGILETVPLSYHVQGTAMHWTNKGMYRTDRALVQWRKAGFDAWLIMQIHDEIVFDFPKGIDPRVNPKKSNLGRARELARLMAKGGDDVNVPTPTSVAYHPDTYSSEIAF